MPELPEVETTRRGLEPHLLGRRVLEVRVRQPALRWPVPAALAAELPGQGIEAVTRRGKYLLFETRAGSLMIHLGMSGSLRIAPPDAAPDKHDHVDIVIDDGRLLRFHDPRRFGSMLWFREAPAEHPLLRELGPEPLTDAFNADYLYAFSRKRKVAVKSFIMDSHVVVGVGNIYANEALFATGIHPKRQAGRVGRASYESLVLAVKEVLASAILQGGTTLRDFVGGDGKPGYFRQSLAVYGRKGQPCLRCQAPLKEIRLGQRSTVYCVHCQR